MNKLSDMVLGDAKKGRMVSAGVFLGSDDQKHLVLLQNRIREHGSLRKARNSIVESHPDLYTTMAFKFEKAPEGPGFFKKILRPGTKAKHEAALSAYNERVSKPRIFITVGPAGSAAQSDFYNDIARAEYGDPKYRVTLKRKSTKAKGLSAKVASAFADELQQILMGT